MFYGLEPDWCISLLVEIPEASTENASERNGLLASKPVGIPPSMCLPNKPSAFTGCLPAQCFLHASARAVCQLSYQYIYSDQILPINMSYPHWLTILVDRMSGLGSRFMACIIVVVSAWVLVNILTRSMFFISNRQWLSAALMLVLLALNLTSLSLGSASAFLRQYSFEERTDLTDLEGGTNIELRVLTS